MSRVDPRSKKYYWLKLEKDFFKRHDIKVIESMDNGKDYLIFYMKLLLESVSHHGLLRFNDTVPYNDKMLSTITNTNIDIVRSAVKIFTELDLMSILDDETIYMKEVEKRMGQETGYAIAKRSKRMLEKEEQGQIETMSHNNSVSISNSKSNSLKIKDMLNKEYFEDEELQEVFIEYLQLRIKNKMVMTDRVMSRLTKAVNEQPESLRVEMIEKAIMGGWKDFFPITQKNEPKKKEYEFNLS